MMMPVNNFQEAIAEFGDRVGIPEINGYFISLERSDRFTIEREGQEISFAHHAGKPSVTLFRRVVGAVSADGAIVGSPVAKFFEVGGSPQLVDLGDDQTFNAAHFDRSENDHFGMFNKVGQSLTSSS